MATIKTMAELREWARINGGKPAAEIAADAPRRPTWDELGLEDVCPECRGRKMTSGHDVDGNQRERVCLHCDGRGVVVSEMGKRLIAFVNRNGHMGTRW